MVVNSFNCEFGYEMISVIPYAHWLYERGELEQTTSGISSEPFYYFSPRHTINAEPRSWYNVCKMNTPNADIHKSELDLSRFSPPQYREYYANDKYHFDLVIYNRHNNEWPGVPELNRPINFFSLELLREIFRNFKGKILYINVDGVPDLYDNAPPIPFYDYALCGEFKHVTVIHDLKESFNLAQLKAFANCRLFLTMNGGGSILASYFGGRNIIYTNPQTVGDRIYPRENQMGDFAYYHHFGGSEIINVHTYNQIIKLLC